MSTIILRKYQLVLDVKTVSPFSY